MDQRNGDDTPFVKVEVVIEWNGDSQSGLVFEPSDGVSANW